MRKRKGRGRRRLQTRKDAGEEGEKEKGRRKTKDGCRGEVMLRPKEEMN